MPKSPPHTWLLLFCALALGGCCKNRYAVRTTAHTMKRIAPFVLLNAHGKTVHVGKPWQKATALVLIRGHW